MKGESKRRNSIKDSIPQTIGIAISFLIAFYIRTIPKAGVFISENFVRFGGNDPWYHLRNVEAILHNFPNMLWFDAHTLYPFGTPQVFAPLYDLVLASVIWIAGFGNPSEQLTYTICAYYPALLGALVIIPTYFTAKFVFGQKVGLLAAFLIAIAPGQFLSRSIIGFNDHHIAETLLSTFTAMFIIMGIKVTQKYEIGFKNITFDTLNDMKTAIFYFALAGIALGSYTLAWKGGLFFSMIIGVYITIQHIVDHMHGRDTSNAALGGIIIFVVALVIVLMTPYLGGSKSLNTKGLIAGIIAFPILTGISHYMNKNRLKKVYYPITLAAMFGFVLFVSKLLLPSVYSLITSVFSYFLRTGGGLTIAEASPLLYIGGQFSLQPLWYNFGAMGYISFIVLGILTYKAFTQKNRAENTFLIVWTLMIIWAMLQQNRFAYYYSVNAAILSAWIGIKVLEMSGWQKLVDSVRSKTFSANSIKVAHILSAAFIILILIYPSYTLAMQQSQGTGGPNGYWIETTQWLRYNTPDPGLNYYGNYEKPESGGLFQYPETAYGVMSWWDYGHWIEVIGRRIPNANPFQSGVGGRRNNLEEENEPGASTFFTAPSEEAATEVLEAIHPDPEKAGARYVVSDVEMATGKFYAMTAWTLDSEGYYIPVQTDVGYQNVPGPRYYNSMEARLHIFDGNGLKQYRLVHESPAGNTQEPGYKNVYNALFGGNLEEKNTGYVKVFEYVEGATITGTAPDGETISISNTIVTSQMRTFTYAQSTTSDGIYSFTVPYSTEGPMAGETQFDAMPMETYTISYGNTTKSVSVSEIDVLNGNVIEV